MRQVQTDWKDEARGKWTGILGQLGVDEKFLRNIHGPCPGCGGVDRFRYDNKDGRGTFFCSSCGAGDGIKLLQIAKRWDFKEAMEAVKGVLGIVLSEDERKGEMSHKDKVARMNRVLEESRPVTKGDPVDVYLGHRGLARDKFPATIRFNPHCWFERDLFLPAMIALVQDPQGNRVNLHRTFLAPGGAGKANVLEPRKVMPGNLPPGSAVRLFRAEPRMGIAEGIETAWAAARLFKMPVWAALNSTLLSQWEPPSGVQELYVFGDNDRTRGGQLAAEALANRVLTRKNPIECEVMVPTEKGDDWNDVLLKDPSQCSSLPSPSHMPPSYARLS